MTPYPPLPLQKQMTPSLPLQGPVWDFIEGWALGKWTGCDDDFAWFEDLVESVSYKEFSSGRFACLPAWENQLPSW